MQEPPLGPEEQGPTLFPPPHLPKEAGSSSLSPMVRVNPQRSNPKFGGRGVVFGKYGYRTYGLALVEEHQGILEQFAWVRGVISRPLFQVPSDYRSTMLRAFGERADGDLHRTSTLVYRGVWGVGGAGGNRTLDLSIANAALSQLSYGPT